MYEFPPGTSSTSLEAGLEPNRLSLDVSRQSRWILKQCPNADFEVYAKRMQHPVHLIKYLEAFMPNDGHKAQSNKVQTILATQPPKRE
jgi:hypothetical protein